MLTRLLPIPGFESDDSPEYQAIHTVINAEPTRTRTSRPVDMEQLTNFLSNPEEFMHNVDGIHPDRKRDLDTLIATAGNGVGNYKEAELHYEQRKIDLEDEEKAIDENRHPDFKDAAGKDRFTLLEDRENAIKEGRHDLPQRRAFRALEAEERALTGESARITNEIADLNTAIERLQTRMVGLRGEERSEAATIQAQIEAKEDAIKGPSDESSGRRRENAIIRRQEQIEKDKLVIQDERDNASRQVTLDRRQLEAEMAEKKRAIAAEKRLLPDLIEAAKTLSKTQGKPKTYDSPRGVLELTIYYLHKFHNKEGDTTMISIQDEVVTAIENERGNIEDEQWEELGLWERMFTVARPTLGQTLKALAHQDKVFAKIGENPSEKLAELAPLIRDASVGHVEKWVNSLPEGVDGKAKKAIVSKLLAYLEFAVREGKINTQFRPERTRDLIRSLRTMQSTIIRDEVAEEAADKNSEEKMILYMNKLNEAARQANKIQEDIITNNATWATGKAGAALGVGGLTAAGIGLTVSAPLLPAIAGGFAAANAARWIAGKFDETMPKEDSEKTNKRTKRYAVYGAIAAGGAALLGPFGLLVPLLRFLPDVYRGYEWMQNERKGITSGKKGKRKLLTK